MFNQVEGIDGTFTDGILMVNNAAQPDWMYWLQPISPAFNILQDVYYDHSCAVAHDGGVYRTIGTIFEFGSLVDGQYPSTKKELLTRFLNFFGIDYSLTLVDYPASPPSDLFVSVYPNPASGQVTFTLETKGTDRSASLVIYDLQGRIITTLLDDQPLSPGEYELKWEGRSSSGSKVSNGLYFYRLTVGNEAFGGKILFIH